VYVLIAIIKKKLKFERSLYTILQVISVNPFNQTTLNELLTQNENMVQNEEDPNQLILFE